MSSSRFRWFRCLGLSLILAARLWSKDAQVAYYGAGPAVLTTVQARLAAGDVSLQSALDHLLQEADRALAVAPPAVTQKTRLGASGDPHDYYSQAPYFWPDPAKPDGRPYLPRDGVVNPESRENSDQERVERLGRTVGTLALAYHFARDERYAEHAARCLRVWFLDEATRMNPNMEQAQAVPGKNTGRGIGIIEAGGVVSAIEAAVLLEASPHWTEADRAGLHVWANAFLDWLLNSQNGRDEAAMTQNHGTVYDVNVVRLALVLGRTELARDICETAKTKRIAVQIEPDGSQPMELRRTKSFNYSRLNLRGLVALAELGQWVDVDLWNYETADGRGIRQAIDFMVPYVRTPAAAWPYQQIVPKPINDLATVLRAAANAYGDRDYEAVVAGLTGVVDDRFQLLRPSALVFHRLGNGHDLSGWVQRGGQAHYAVEDGDIVGTSVPDSPNSFLCTPRDYSDFVLEYEFKVDPRLNSGVQIRSEVADAPLHFEWAGGTRDIPAGRVHGYQIEIDPDVKRARMWTAGIYDEARRGWLYPAAGNPAQEAAFSTQGLETFKPGDWNRVRVEARGSHLRTWLNGHLRADLHDDQTARGFIALQVHGIPNAELAGAQVRWRNLRIAELPTADAGFTRLFNGENLDGWEVRLRKGDEALKQKVFTVENGEVHVFGGLPDRYELDTGDNATHGMIYTTKSYRNFIFRFDYKWGSKIANNFAQFQYDAGCYYHVVDPKIWPQGIEFQVRYNHLEDRNHTGDFWSPPNTVIRWTAGPDNTYLPLELGGVLQDQHQGEHRAVPDAPFHGTDGQWNHCEVIVMGGHYAIHKLNGMIVNVATDITPSEGLIGLQAETAEIFYRHIAIKEFSAPLPIATFLP